MMRRWDAHVNAALKGSRLVFSWAIRKHGVENWSHEVLDVLKTLKAAKHAERLWIGQRRTCMFEHPASGYNMTHGGDGGGMLGHVPTQEHREKLSAALKGLPKSLKARKNMRLAKLGKPSNAKGSKRTPEWRQVHIGDKSNNHKLTEAKKLEIIIRWQNRHISLVTQRDLAREYGVTQSTISRMVNGVTWRTNVSPYEANVAS